MSWGTRKAYHVEHMDRISDLPSNVIDGILQHLPIQDLARTSILSRKWRFMWLSVPRLEFGNDFFLYCERSNIEEPEISGIITEILLLHNSPIIQFILEIPAEFSIPVRCLYTWILFLSRRSIKELVLVNRNHAYCLMPSHLFSCQELTYLELNYFDLSLPPNFCGFKSLLELHLYDIVFESSALDNLISGCPVLCTLIISNCFGFDCINVSVSAPCLKVLKIEASFKSICFKETNHLTNLTLTSLSTIEWLCLGECHIKVGSFGSQSLQRSINSLKYLQLDVDFNRSRERMFVFSLLENSPNLVELVIMTCCVSEAPEPDHLRASDCNSFSLSQLQKVKIVAGTAYAAYEQART